MTQAMNKIIKKLHVAAIKYINFAFNFLRVVFFCKTSVHLTKKKQTIKKETT